MARPRPMGPKSNAARGEPDAPGRAQALARLLPSAWTGAFAAVVLVYVALKTYHLALASSDENIYFYMAARTVFGGLAPYRDYFFAHPPLHLGLAALALKVG